MEHSKNRESQYHLKRKKSIYFCSTPVETQANKLMNISISAVETNSSSSTIKTKKRTERKKQRRTTKRKFEKDSDTDWETKSEQSVYDETLSPGPSKQSISDSADNVLFIDLTSPEHVRDAPRLIDDRLESPIVQSNQWRIKSPKKIRFEEKDILPLKELPFLNVPFDDSDEEEQPLLLKKENAVKTYPEIRSRRPPKKPISIDKSKRWLIDVKVPTTTSDLLWDDFVKNNYTKVRKYLATSPKSKQIPHQEKGGKTKKGNDRSTVANDETTNWKGFQVPVDLKRMEVVRKRWGKSSQKCIETYDSHKRTAAKKKPTIRKVETLSTIRYNKDKQTWEHI